MKIKLISGKRLPRYAVICANFRGIDNFPIGDFHKLQNCQAVEVDAVIGHQFVAGGWCYGIQELPAQLAKIAVENKSKNEIDEEGE